MVLLYKGADSLCGRDLLKHGSRRCDLACARTPGKAVWRRVTGRSENPSWHPLLLSGLRARSGSPDRGKVAGAALQRAVKILGSDRTERWPPLKTWRSWEFCAHQPHFANESAPTDGLTVGSSEEGYGGQITCHFPSAAERRLSLGLSTRTCNNHILPHHSGSADTPSGIQSGASESAHSGMGNSTGAPTDLKTCNNPDMLH